MKDTAISTKNLFDKVRKGCPELDIEYIAKDKSIRSKDLIHYLNSNFKFAIYSFVSKSNYLFISFDFGEIKQCVEAYQLINTFNRESIFFYKAYLEFSKSKIVCHFKIQFVIEVKDIEGAADEFVRAINFLNSNLADLIKPIYSLTVYGNENKIEKMS